MELTYLTHYSCGFSVRDFLFGVASEADSISSFGTFTSFCMSWSNSLKPFGFFTGPSVTGVSLLNAHKSTVAHGDECFVDFNGSVQLVE